MIFVTGGTGLLGNCIIRELCARGEPVRALCRPGTSRECFEDLPVEIVEGDLSHAEKLAEAAQDCQAFIHSAAMIHIGWQKLEQSREVNVEGTRRVVEACSKSGSRLIYVSTVDTLPAATSVDCPINESRKDTSGNSGIAKPACSYVTSKQEAEQVVWDALQNDTQKLDAVVLNPGFMLSPFDWKPSSGRMMLEVHKAPLVAAPPGGCSFCDARDVANAIVNSVELGQSGEQYILAGRNWTYQQLWQHMLAAMDKKKRVFRMGSRIKYVGKLIDLWLRLFSMTEGDVNGAAIAMGSLNHFYDSTKAEKALGYKCRPPKETLREAWNWIREHHLAT